MKCILPLARGGGYNKTDNRTPYFAQVAGKPLLGHLIDQVVPLKPEEVIFILGEKDQERIMEFVKSEYSFPARFILQRQNKGSAHAILGAQEHVQGEVLILFGDTFFDADVKAASKSQNDGAIWTYKVDDPRELGVVFVQDGLASKLIEKPDEPVSTDAIVGLYFIRDAQKLFDAAHYLIEHGIMTKGSFMLTDALQVMIERGSRIAAVEADDWVDADHDDGLFRLNAKFLAKEAKALSKPVESVIIKPVYIGKDVLIRNSVVGPNVSIGDGAAIVGSVVKESLVGEHARVSNSKLSMSVIGEGAHLSGSFRQVTLDEHSQSQMD